ncbi:MAG: THUMP domain-containing protein [Candidatus Thorarchaeota archaeon]
MNAVLISAERHRRRDALSEAWYVFSEHLGLSPRRYQCRIPGLAIIKVDQDVLEVMGKIRHFVLNNQPSFLACLTFTPLHKLFRLPPAPKDTLRDFEEDVDQFLPIIEALGDIMHLIGTEESWRITVRKRYSSLRSQEIITKIADSFSLPGPVSLTNPEKIIRVEILGLDCGVSIHKPQDVISLPKLAGAGS